MPTTLPVVFPIFAIVVAGWMARRLRVVEPSAFRALRDVVFYLTMPAFLFSSIAQGPAVDIFGVATVYFAACLLVFGLALVAARAIGLPLPRAAMLGLNSSYGNTVMIGIPVAVSALGADALPPLLAIIALHSAILLPVAGILMEAEAGEERRGPVAIVRGILGGTLRNPIIMAIPLAFLWRAGGLPLPGPIEELLRMLGAAATPLALLCLGGTLPALNLRALGVETALALLLKLAVLPSLVWALAIWLQLPPLPLAVAVLTAAMPTGANAFLLAHRNDELIEVSAGTVLTSTILSVITVSVLLKLVG
jgi:predicted permease